MTWFKENTKIKSKKSDKRIITCKDKSSNVYSLQICDATMEDAGEYRTMVKNTAGLAIVATVVKVQPIGNNKPIESDMLQTGESVTLQTGESVTLQTSESVTLQTAESVTLQTDESVTLQTSESVTLQTSESDTLQTAESVTLQTSESVTLQTSESDTMQTTADAKHEAAQNGIVAIIDAETHGDVVKPEEISRHGIDGDLQSADEPVKPDTTEQVKPDTTEQVKPDLSEQVKPDLAEQVKPDTVEEVKPDTTEEVKSDIAEQVKPDMAEQVKPEMVEQVKPDTTEEVKPDIAEQVKLDTAEQVKLDIAEHVKSDMAEQVKLEIEEQVKPDIAEQVTLNITEVQSDMTKEVKPDITEQVKPGITEPVKPDMAEQVKPDLTEQVKPDLTEQVKPDITEQAKPDMAEVKPDMAEQVKPDMAEQVKPDMTEQVKPDMAEQVKTDMAEVKPDIVEEVKQNTTEQVKPDIAEQVKPNSTDETQVSEECTDKIEDVLIAKVVDVEEFITVDEDEKSSVQFTDMQTDERVKSQTVTNKAEDSMETIVITTMKTELVQRLESRDDMWEGFSEVKEEFSQTVEGASTEVVSSDRESVPEETVDAPEEFTMAMDWEENQQEMTVTMETKQETVIQKLVSTQVLEEVNKEEIKTENISNILMEDITQTLQGEEVISRSEVTEVKQDKQTIRVDLTSDHTSAEDILESSETVFEKAFEVAEVNDKNSDLDTMVVRINPCDVLLRAPQEQTSDRLFVETVDLEGIQSNEILSGEINVIDDAEGIKVKQDIQPIRVDLTFEHVLPEDALEKDETRYETAFGLAELSNLERMEMHITPCTILLGAPKEQQTDSLFMEEVDSEEVKAEDIFTGTIEVMHDVMSKDVIQVKQETQTIRVDLVAENRFVVGDIQENDETEYEQALETSSSCDLDRMVTHITPCDIVLAAPSEHTIIEPYLEEVNFSNKYDEDSETAKELVTEGLTRLVTEINPCDVHIALATAQESDTLWVKEDDLQAAGDDDVFSIEVMVSDKITEVFTEKVTMVERMQTTETQEESMLCSTKITEEESVDKLKMEYTAPAIYSHPGNVTCSEFGDLQMTFEVEG